MKVSKLIEFLEESKIPDAEIVIQRPAIDLGEITLTGNYELKVYGIKLSDDLETIMILIR